MTDDASNLIHLSLLAVGGPDECTLTLEPPGPLTIGRRDGHDLQLADPVSRDHAVLVYEERNGRALWYLIDTESKHGTRLNGIPLLTGRRYPIQPRDLIEITPWTFQLVDPAAREGDQTVVPTLDDASGHGNIDIIQAQPQRDQAQRRLALLLQCAESIHEAEDAEALASVVLEASIIGTGFSNAAFLRPMANDGTISVVSQLGEAVGDPSNPRLSRSLIQRASSGKPARLTRERDQIAHGASILELGIDEALCVPITLGGAIAGFLYLDSRKNERSTTPIAPDATEFALGIGRIAAMALANLMRLDLQRRTIEMEADLRATGEAQQLVLPPRTLTCGPLRYVGESRAGRVISGDFFNVIPLDENRLAIILGDVVGKGIISSVLMTTSHGFLHAAMLDHGEPARAAASLNRFIRPRCKAGSFITLWIGVVDPNEQSLKYVDLGHGYAMLHRAGGSITELVEGGGMPIGIAENEVDQSTIIVFHPGDRVLLVSDGIVEQKAGRSRPNAGEQFGRGRAHDLFQQRAGERDVIDLLFDAVTEHAGTTQLADDATAVLVEWA